MTLLQGGAAAAKRSQSTSRIELRRQYRDTPPTDDDDQEEGVATRYLISRLQQLNEWMMNEFILHTLGYENSRIAE